MKRKKLHQKFACHLEPSKVLMGSATVNKGPGRRSGSRQEPLVKGKTALRFTPSLFVGHIFSGRKVRVTLSLRVYWQKKRSRHPKSITLSKILCAHTGRGRSWRRQTLGRGLSKHLCCRKGPFIFSPRLTQTSVSWSSVTEQSGTASNKTSCWQRRSQTAPSEDAVNFAFLDSAQREHVELCSRYTGWASTRWVNTTLVGAETIVPSTLHSDRILSKY